MDTPEPIVVPMKTGFGLIGVGITKGYELVNDGETETVRIGRARRLVVSSLRAYIERLRATRKAA